MMAPIPGMSLTEQPKSKPWLRPPRIPHPEGVFQYYNDKLNKESKAIEGIVGMAKEGLTVKNIVEGILRSGTARGLHTIDAGLVVAPLLHEKVKGMVKAFGVEPDDGFVDKEALKEKQLQERKVIYKDAVKQALKAKKSGGGDNMMSEAPKGLPPKETQKSEAPVGLMKRRNT